MKEVLQSGQGEPVVISSPNDLCRPLTATAADASPPAVSAADKSAFSTVVKPAADCHSKFGEEVHNYVREYIRNADQKAGLFFAALTALLAYLNSQHVPARWMKSPAQWSFVDALGFFSMFGLAAGAALLLAVVFPRLKGSRRGLLFFNAISEYDSSGEYARDVVARSNDELITAKLQHCYDLSKVCSAKYKTLRAGFWVGSVGAGAGLLFLLLSRIS